MGSSEDDTELAFNIVAAIDFGTTTSGYAYTFRDEYVKTPRARQIYKSEWESSFSRRGPKAPTTALFDTTMKFHSFGFEAEEKYADLIDKKEHADWYLFRRFKMQLHNRTTLKRGFEIEDEQKRLVPARKVFTESIRYMKSNLEDTLEKRNPSSLDQILWVITVPAIWTEPSKNFMRETAIEAGIKDDRLLLALEPEAAAVFCKSYLAEGTMRETTDDIIKDGFKIGGRYMLMDLGGGTIDTTVHKVNQCGKLVELTSASGGAWGGVSVDENFHKYLESVLGSAVLNKCKNAYAYDWMKLQEEFETQKRKVKSSVDTKFRIQIPPRLFMDSEMKVNTTSFDKLDVPKVDVINFFKSVTNQLVEHASNTLEKAGDIKLILMVGGFAESKFVQTEMKAAFPNHHVIVPLQAETAVLQGAVLFGFEPRYISARIMRHTYGVRLYRQFRENVDPPKFKREIDGEILCNNRFEKIVNESDTIEFDEVKKIKTKSSHRTNSRRHLSMSFAIFACKGDAPTYTTEDKCVKIGDIKVEPPAEGWPNIVNYRLELFFGRTELTIKVFNDASNAVYDSRFDLLE